MELIVIDGGSTDETISILKKHEKKISYWISEPDNGQAHAVNKGLKMSTGDYFNWINSDDYLENDALQVLADHVTANPDNEVVCGYTRCFWNEDNRTSHEYRMGVKSSIADSIVNVEMNQPGTFYKIDILRKLGGVNESLRYVLDDELWFRYLCAYGTNNIGFVNARFAQFRLHSYSKSVREGYTLFNQELQAIYFTILKNLDSPKWLLSAVEEELEFSNYKPSDNWQFNYLERSKYLSHFASKYIISIYKSGKFRAAKEALRLMRANGYFRWNRIHLSLVAKLMFR